MSNKTEMVSKRTRTIGKSKLQKWQFALIEIYEDVFACGYDCAVSPEEKAQARLLRRVIKQIKKVLDEGGKI